MKRTPVACRDCEHEVLWLPYAWLSYVNIPVDVRPKATDLVMEELRWGWRRGVGLVPLAAAPMVPPQCLVLHACAVGWVRRGFRRHEHLSAEVNADVEFLDRLFDASYERQRMEDLRQDDFRYGKVR